MKDAVTNTSAMRTLRYLPLIAVILSAVLMAGCGAQTQEVTVHDDAVLPYTEDSEIIEQQETLPPIQISMPEYEFSYSGELADLIVTEENPEDNGLAFRVKLSAGEATVFILHFNRTEGELVQMLDDAQGNKIPVAFEMMAIPEGLNEKDADIFYTAQDAVNEIVASLKVK